MMTHDVMIVLLSLLTTCSDAVCVITNCAQCNGNSASGCNLCNDGFWLQSGECIPCPSHCSLCTYISQCRSCVTSHWNPGQLCNFVCPVNCSESGCEDTTGYCYECLPGKYGQACNRDCCHCINGESDLRKCTVGCKDGYLQYNSGTDSYCRPCPTNCIKCSNTTYCTQCEQGVYANYYRATLGGRGKMTCKQCWEPCTQCMFNDRCAEECKTVCIKQGCDVSGDCVTTRSTSRTICSNKCKDNCDTHGDCHTTTASNSKHAYDYYEGSWNCYRNRHSRGRCDLLHLTKCLRIICPTKTTTCSREHHVYVNAQEDTGTMPTSINRPLHNEANTNSEIHATLSEEDVNTIRKYVCLGERRSENDYSDLQTNRRDEQ